MKRASQTMAFLAILLVLATSSAAGEYQAMTSPNPPYSINKGLRVKGIAVDTLAVMMSLTGIPMEDKDVKLMLWQHAYRITSTEPNKIMLNVPRTDENSDTFKWVGPLDVCKYVVVGRKDYEGISSLTELDNQKIATIKNSLAEKTLLKSGVPKSTLASGATHILPLKQLAQKKVDYFAHSDMSTAYLMCSIRMNPNKFKILHTFHEEPLYYAFSKDTDDALISKLNATLKKMKTPGSDGKSWFDKIVAKYLPKESLN